MTHRQTVATVSAILFRTAVKRRVKKQVGRASVSLQLSLGFGVLQVCAMRCDVMTDTVLSVTLQLTVA